MAHLLLHADARRLPLADRSVHCVVTSPPYWGLRDYGVDGQIGLEPTPDAYVRTLVEVFREVRRVLRDDGTLWLNLGGCYNSSPPGNRNPMSKSTLHGVHTSESYRERLIRTQQDGQEGRRLSKDFKPKDMIPIPWMVAMALQADGWYLRSDIIWSKPNPMPSSVTDRPTTSHEYLFLLAKSPRYFYDQVATFEPVKEVTRARDRYTRITKGKDGPYAVVHDHETPSNPLGRNRRTVWEVATRAFKGAHFATFPPDLIKPCILAGTSRKGCCSSCGAPVKRVVEKDFVPLENPGVVKGGIKGMDPSNGWGETPRGYVSARTVGWARTCRCDPHDLVPCRVLDPFGGAMTTVLVSEELGRVGIGAELSAEYLEMARDRLLHPHRPKPKRDKSSRPMPLFD